MRKSVALVSGVVLMTFVSTALAEVRARRKFNCDDKGARQSYSYCVEGASADAARAEYKRQDRPYDQLYAPPPPGSGPAPEGSGSVTGGGGGGGGGGGK